MRNESPEPGHVRQPLETLTFERPRCPACRGVRLTKYRSIADQGDGSALAWVRCRDCGRRFKVLLHASRGVDPPWLGQ